MFRKKNFRHYASGSQTILFSKAKRLREINIFFESHSIKQHKTVEYLWCQLDSKLSRKAMTSNVLKKINVKLKFLHRQSRYLPPAYKRLLCHVLIHAHFDYECSSWFLLLKKNWKLKLQKIQIKCICYCPNSPPRSHIDPLYFRKINCLPTSDRVQYCNTNTVFKCWNKIVPG